MQKMYRMTIAACYVGTFTQAIVVNLTPVIFIPLREAFGLSYAQFGFLVLINFITQVAVDIGASRAVDRHGFRPFVVAAHIICVSGLLLFAAAPAIFPANEFWGFVIATVIFSGSGGLLEVLLSPIVDAIPSDEKDKSMAMLHSCYAWGQVSVIIFTSLAVFFGVSWQIIVIIWAAVPFLNIFLFARAPLRKHVSEKGAMRISELFRSRVFVAAFVAIAFGGAAEVTMSQWASAYMEKGLALPKIFGDSLGMCGYAATLGIGRMAYGILGSRLNLNRVLILGSLGALICYITVALSPFSWLSIAACIMTGLCVSLLWPGTLVLASSRLPRAGASMFALLAAGGDIGASAGSWLTGIVTDFSISHSPNSLSLSSEQFGLRAGILFAGLFPLISFVSQIVLKSLRARHIRYDDMKDTF